METLSALLAILRGIHRSPVNSAHKGQWRGALMFSLICVWINGWVNNREAGDLRRDRAHYDVIVMPDVIVHVLIYGVITVKVWKTKGCQFNNFIITGSTVSQYDNLTVPPVTTNLSNWWLFVFSYHVSKRGHWNKFSDAKDQDRQWFLIRPSKKDLRLLSSFLLYLLYLAHLNPYYPSLLPSPDHP